MDISSRFSLADFLAYLFPGIFASIGVYLLLLLTPLETSLKNFPTDLTTGVLFLVFSYIVGVAISGFAETIANRMRYENSYIPLSGFQSDVKKAFKDVFGTKESTEWTRTHFYLCRSMVFEYMPNEIQGIQRQNSLRQLRMNILPSIFIWVGAGIGWGWRSYNVGMKEWGIAVVIASAILGPLLLIMTANRMQNNLNREMRETLAAFLCGYRTGLFDKQKHSTAKPPSQV